MTLPVLSRYSLAFQSAVIEDTPTRASLKRSVKLLEGSLRRAVIVYFLFFTLYLDLAITLGLVSEYLTGWFHLPYQIVLTLSSVSAFACGVVTIPMLTIALSLIYYDERIRKEAFDLQLRSRGSKHHHQPRLQQPRSR